MPHGKRRFLCFRRSGPRRQPHAGKGPDSLLRPSKLTQIVIPRINGDRHFPAIAAANTPIAKLSNPLDMRLSAVLSRHVFNVLGAGKLSASATRVCVKPIVFTNNRRVFWKKEFRRKVEIVLPENLPKNGGGVPLAWGGRAAGMRANCRWQARAVPMWRTGDGSLAMVV